ncbi:hypothetical protein FMEAI12_4410014 [Parafrankia sp. Ea1.12]|nr:hypothetical protein FMEAI12_4410014 [Parafrankia sp. Ea1.12]
MVPSLAPMMHAWVSPQLGQPVGLYSAEDPVFTLATRGKTAHTSQLRREQILFRVGDMRWAPFFGQ